MNEAPATSMIYCLSCGYALIGLEVHRCPECGRVFDPAKRRTFSRSRHGWLVRRWVRRLTVVAGVALVLGGALGVFYYTHIWRPNRLMMTEAWWRDTTPAERLAVAHKILRWGGNDHDAFIEIHQHGGPESMPYLLMGLRRQGVTSGAITCAKKCCLDAMQAITNQNAGENYSDWKAWWDKNKDKSREQWIREGFAKLGIPATGPLDDRCVIALIHLLTGNKDKGNNAWYLLSRVPEKQLQNCVGMCMADSLPSTRRCAAEALGRWKANASRAQLRTLCNDEDLKVRESALTRLNGILGEVDARPAEAITLWKMHLGSIIYRLCPGANEHQILAEVKTSEYPNERGQWLVVDLRDRRVTESDLPTDTKAPVTGTHNSRVYVTYEDGRVQCLDGPKGRCLWTQALGHGQDVWEVSGPWFLDDAPVVVGRSFVAGLDPTDGRVFWKQAIRSGRHNVQVVDSCLYVEDGQTIRKIGADGQIVAQREFAQGVSSFLASQDIVYITTMAQPSSTGVVGTPIMIVACSASTLDPLWQVPLPAPENYSSIRKRVEDVLVLSGQRSMMGLDAFSGSLLWSTADSVWWLGSLPDGSIAVTGGVPRRLEVRDRHSGEVIRSYAGMNLSGMCTPLYLPKHGLVCADCEGQVWLLRWPLGKSTSSTVSATRPAR